MGLISPIIIGYSDGGQAALEFALRHPGKAASFVFGGTVCRPTATYLESLHRVGLSRAGRSRFRAPAAGVRGRISTISAGAHGHHYGRTTGARFLAQISELWLTLPEYQRGATGLDRERPAW